MPSKGKKPAAKGKPGSDLNERQRKFCLQLVRGNSQAEAYRRAGYASASPDVEASVLASKPSVAKYLDYLRENAETNAICSLAEAKEFLAAIVRTPVGEVDERHSLAQEVRRNADGTVHVKMPGKVEALRELSRIEGWNAPEKVEVTSDPISELLSWVRQREQ